MTQNRRARTRAWVGTALALIAPALALAQQSPAPSYRVHRDLIRGRVTNDSGAALAGATIAVTMAPNRDTQLATADSVGRYAIVFEHGTGDYLVHVAAPNREAFRKRVTRVDDDSVFVVDARLHRSVQQLATVAVRAKRARIARETDTSLPNTIGAREDIANAGVVAAVPADQLGNLDAMLATLPGMSGVPGGGVSVLGLAPTQNGTTLNGLAFDGTSVPRGARTQTTVALSTYDPSRGGFSGAQTRVALTPGDINISRRAYLTLDSPRMQASDVVAAHTGQEFAALDLNVGAAGATNMDRWVYNTGLQVKRQFADAASILDANPDILSRAGVAQDSVARLLSALNTLGIPTATRDAPRLHATDVINFMGRLDRPFFDYNTYTPTNTTWGLTGFASRSHTGALNASPTSTPAHGGEMTDFSGGLQGVYSSYFGAQKDQLNDTKTGISVRHVRTSPYVALPDGRVLVSSTSAHTGNSLASLGFAGNAALDAERTTATWEATNDTYFYWKGRATHRGKLSLDSRMSAYSIDNPSNRLGTYSYNSLADLASNTPATFTRTLWAPTRTGGEWQGAAALADNWTTSARFTVLYGARLEGNVFTKAPATNSEIERLFGASTSHAPNTIGLSPRVGFNWYFTSTRSNPMSAGPIGTIYSIPKGVLRGGIGQFRQALDPTLLSDASVSTGLRGSARRLACFGPAVPFADWRAFKENEAAIPSTCDGSPSATFADSAPGVQLFDRGYRPAVSWRGNLSWSSSISGVAYVVDATYALHRSQPSIRDLNFRAQPVFRLANEADRPVFVPTGSIVSATGALSPGEARISSSYGPVLSRTSDLRGSARQISVRVRPNMDFVGRWTVDATYTYADARMQSRGFDGGTFDDPNAVVVARADYTPRHELVIASGFATSWIAATVYGKARSGLPFTPLIGSDVNGDGFANDRAYIFNPTATADTGLAAGMRALLQSTSSRSRDCLLRQLSSVASKNSCDGPWTAALNMSIAPGYAVTRHLPFQSHFPSITLYVTNPLGGLDQLLHGNDMKGWGSPSIADPILYYVRGFDSTARAYRYEVNPRFGNTRPSATALRTPFRITLDVSAAFGPSNDEQQVERMLRSGRNGNPGARLDSAATVRRYCGNLPDWYAEILQQSDSLLLSRDQVNALVTARSAYLARVRAHWGRFAAHLVAIGDRYDAKDLAKQQADATDRAWDLARDEAQHTLPTVLTAVQLSILPGNAKLIFESDEPIRGVRYFSTRGC